MWNTVVGDEGAQSLAEHCPGLEIVRVSETRISDVGLAALCANCPRIKKLFLHGTRCTLEGRQKFEQKHPETKIFGLEPRASPEPSSGTVEIGI